MDTGGRRRYIDWLRGLAVLIMIEAHVFDSWTRVADRSSVTYRNLIVLAGLAAPLFLWLAGLASVLSAERALTRTGDRRSAAMLVCRRGLEIFILAFLFRIQAFILSPGASLVTIFRVDILNVMGPAVVAVGLVWWVFEERWALAVAFAALTTAVGMATPLVRVAQWVGSLPVWVQWHLRPAGDNTVFTLFPWGGFALGGAFVGVLLAGVHHEAAERRLHRVLGPSGLALVGLGFYTSTLPTIYRESSFWTSSPTYYAIRLGLMTAALSAAYSTAWVLERWTLVVRPLERLGRSSLFVYWIHVEMVYGYLSWPIRRRLPVEWTCLAYALFCLLMLGAVAVRDMFASGLIPLPSMAYPIRIRNRTL